MPSTHFPVVIVGGGPAGATASLFLSQMGVEHLLAEKSAFPRDKICGDAISGKALDVLNKVIPDSLTAFCKGRQSISSTDGMIFGAPNGRTVEIAFPKPKTELPIGIICKRADFDHFLFLQAAENAQCHPIIGQVKSAVRDGEKWKVEVLEGDMPLRFSADHLLIADGAQSQLKKALHANDRDDNHFCAGIRQYHAGIAGMHPQNYLELRFYPQILPGYLWIFGLPNAEANVGLGMLSKDVKTRKANLRKMLADLIETQPELKERFKTATPLENAQGWGLPLGSREIAISGAGYLLLGDAASLIDPFTGEGIANAVVSGMVAARIIGQSAEHKKLNAEVRLSEYDAEIYRKLKAELQLSRRIQQLTRVPWLFNLVVSRISGSRPLAELFTNMFIDLDLRKKLKRPGFYLRLLTGRA